MTNKEVLNNVDIWVAHVDQLSDPDSLEFYISQISIEEREQMDSFMFDRDRKVYLITRAIVRIVMSHYFSSINPCDFRFKVNEFGRPSIDERVIGGEIDFNISHSGNLIVLAISDGVSLGVDVESDGKINASMIIPKMVFNESEARLVEGSDPNIKKEFWLKIWTVKEAYAKASGLGLSADFGAISVSFISKNPTVSLTNMAEKEKSNGWMFYQCIPRAGYVLALAVNAEGPPVNINSWKIMSLCDGVKKMQEKYAWSRLSTVTLP